MQLKHEAGEGINDIENNGKSTQKRAKNRTGAANTSRTAAAEQPGATGPRTQNRERTPAERQVHQNAGNAQRRTATKRYGNAINGTRQGEKRRIEQEAETQAGNDETSRQTKQDVR
jgi:hypothetical protein